MTAAKLAANRANAKLSTGPSDSARTRFNGLQHGLTSKQVVIPGESQEEYENFRVGLLSDLKPHSALEQTLADRVVAGAWRLKRFQRVEGAFYTNRIDDFLKEHPGADPDAALANLFIDPMEIAKLRLFLRYQNAVQREFDKAMSEFRGAQADHQVQLLEEAAAGFASYEPAEYSQVPYVPATTAAGSQAAGLRSAAMPDFALR
jgi:hypothetical protein